MDKGKRVILGLDDIRSTLNRWGVNPESKLRCAAMSMDGEIQLTFESDAQVAERLAKGNVGA